MLTLALELSNPTTPPGAAVALGTLHAGSAQLLAAEPVAPAARERDDLIPAIDRLLRAHGAKPADLRGVAVSIGPGGYTALRVAVATAKMIALANSAVVFAVPSALVAAEHAQRGDAGPGRAVSVALAAKADSAWWTDLPEGWRTRADVGTGRVLLPTDLAQQPAGVLLADAHLPPALRDAASTRGWRIEPLSLDPAALLRAAARAQPTDPEHLAPLYGREPEAVTLWRQRTGGAGGAKA
jgi:tRNA threonylcarbamoyladenosine biosynthesis protein TsaB